MMKKDFEAIASIIKGVRDTQDVPGSWNAILTTVTLALAGYCATTNSQFDKDRFLRACGLGWWR